MNKKLLAPKVNKQHVCDAFGCLEIATELISVQAGQHGSICLYLCKACVSKFEGEVRV